MRRHHRLSTSIALVITWCGVASLQPAGYQRAAGTALPQQPHDVVAAFPLRGTSPRFDVMVNGQGPFLFGFDSGASGDAWVTAALVRRLNLPAAAGGIRVSDGSGLNSRETSAVRIDRLQMGGLSLRDLRAGVLGEGPTQDAPAEPLGTLGFEAFRDYLLTIDYAQGEFRVSTGELPAPDGDTVLNYSHQSGTPHVEVGIADRTVLASIDSGSGGGVMLPRSFAQTVPLRAPVRAAGKVASSLGQFDLFRGDLAGDLRIGGFTLHEPAIFFSDITTVPNIGRGILRSFAVTFDQRNRRIQFVRPSQR